jgi:hypothetical protein
MLLRQYVRSTNIQCSQHHNNASNDAANISKASNRASIHGGASNGGRPGHVKQGRQSRPGVGRKSSAPSAAVRRRAPARGRQGPSPLVPPCAGRPGTLPCPVLPVTYCCGARERALCRPAGPGKVSPRARHGLAPAAAGRRLYAQPSWPFEAAAVPAAAMEPPAQLDDSE